MPLTIFNPTPFRELPEDLLDSQLLLLHFDLIVHEMLSLPEHILHGPSLFEDFPGNSDGEK